MPNTFCGSIGCRSSSAVNNLGRYPARRRTHVPGAETHLPSFTPYFFTFHKPETLWEVRKYGTSRGPKILSKNPGRLRRETASTVSLHHVKHKTKRQAIGCYQALSLFLPLVGHIIIVPTLGTKCRITLADGVAIFKPNNTRRNNYRWAPSLVLI